MKELIMKFKEKSREAFVSFMQERKALMEEIGKDKAEKQLLKKYSAML